MPGLSYVPQTSYELLHIAEMPEVWLLQHHIYYIFDIGDIGFGDEANSPVHSLLVQVVLLSVIG